MERRWGQRGSPWEFNLRDMFRWCELMQADQSPGFYNPGQHVALVYADRMRTEADKALVRSYNTHVQDEAVCANTLVKMFPESSPDLHRCFQCSGRCLGRTLSLTVAPESSTSPPSTCRYTIMKLLMLTLSCECLKSAWTELKRCHTLCVLPRRWAFQSSSAVVEPLWPRTPHCPSHIRPCGPWSP